MNNRNYFLITKKNIMTRSLIYCTSLLVLFFATSSFQLTNTNKASVTSNLFIPFNQSFFAGTEMVSFSGQLHLLTIYFPNDPIRIHTNIINMEGIGESTGTKYQVVGSNNTSVSVAAGSQFQVDQLYRLLPPNPVLPPNPIRMRYTIDLDLDGFVTNATAEMVIVEGVTN